MFTWRITISNNVSEELFSFPLFPSSTMDLTNIWYVCVFGGGGGGVLFLKLT